MAQGIPFNKVWFAGREQEYMREAVAGGHLCGNGPFTKRTEALLESMLGTKRALLTTSCTHALEMAALLLDLQPGDEIVLPSFTFVSTANAFALRGATIVFCDVRPDTLNLDERILPTLITSRTRAVVVVHYGGIACALDEIGAICRERGVVLIEDNAHGLMGRYRGQWLGTFGTLATQSFHETKNFSCGEGGALLVNDPALAERAEILREKGTNRSRFLRGQVDKYTWVDLGSSYVPSDMLAAMLLGQLEAREEIQARRRAIWERYDCALAGGPTTVPMETPQVPPECEQPYHLYYLLLENGAVRDRFIASMKAQGMTCPFHYVPLHLSEMGRKLGGREGQCPVTESMTERLVRLPLYPELSADEQAQVIELVRKFAG